MGLDCKAYLEAIDNLWSGLSQNPIEKVFMWFSSGTYERVGTNATLTRFAPCNMLLTTENCAKKYILKNENCLKIYKLLIEFKFKFFAIFPNKFWKKGHFSSPMAYTNFILLEIQTG